MLTLVGFGYFAATHMAMQPLPVPWEMSLLRELQSVFAYWELPKMGGDPNLDAKKNVAQA
jgi:hypothetical protein